MMDSAKQIKQRLELKSVPYGVQYLILTAISILLLWNLKYISEDILPFFVLTIYGLQLPWERKISKLQ